MIILVSLFVFSTSAKQHNNTIMYIYVKANLHSSHIYPSTSACLHEPEQNTNLKMFKEQFT